MRYCANNSSVEVKGRGLITTPSHPPEQDPHRAGRCPTKGSHPTGWEGSPPWARPLSALSIPPPGTLTADMACPSHQSHAPIVLPCSETRASS
ncbi:hypothetical protein AALO_G00008510 [Alosa alosa]|uniref:Uncharacterized protein n=1 Tax=Alosa alosa TaxID=278164 RepID=A0AAV6HHE2_9TELE|nr:hypothetical protein AALO_G00008510 [Alosa alosa]